MRLEESTRTDHARRPGLRVATLNCFGLRADTDRRMFELAAAFATLDADLVLLQETILTDEIDQAREIVGPEMHLAQQRVREQDGQGVTIASRWPIVRSREVDLDLTPRSAGFAATTLVAEIDAPEPWGRVHLANHLPDYRPAHERERELQAVAAAHELERIVAERHGHVIVGGDFDADPAAASVRFWTGLQSVEETSVCYRDAWAVVHGSEPRATFVPDNPYSADWDWPFRSIDYVLVRCLEHGGPSLAVRSCSRILDSDEQIVSDHFGLIADLELPPTD